MSAYSKAALEVAADGRVSLNRDRRALLKDIHEGRVWRHEDGHFVRRARTGPNAFYSHQRVAAGRVEELADAGLVDLDTLKLTDTGLAVIEVAA